MISSSLKERIDRFFPELGFTAFQKRFDIPDFQVEQLTLEFNEYLNRRIMNIASDISVEMSTWDESAKHKEEEVNKTKNKILYTVSKKNEFKYKDFSNFDGNGKNAITNEDAREAFASLVVSEMIKNGDLEDPAGDRARANIMKSLWFCLQEVGERIDSFGINESTRIKHSSRSNT